MFPYLSHNLKGEQNMISNAALQLQCRCRQDTHASIIKSCILLLVASCQEAAEYEAGNIHLSLPASKP